MSPPLLFLSTYLLLGIDWNPNAHVCKSQRSVETLYKHFNGCIFIRLVSETPLQNFPFSGTKYTAVV